MYVVLDCYIVLHDPDITVTLKMTILLAIQVDNTARGAAECNHKQFSEEFSHQRRDEAVYVRWYERENAIFENENV